MPQHKPVSWGYLQCSSLGSLAAAVLGTAATAPAAKDSRSRAAERAMLEGIAVMERAIEVVITILSFIILYRV